MSSASDSTETNLGEPGRDERRLGPYLFVVLEGGRPLAGGARLALDDLDTVAIGRGETRALSRSDRAAELGLPDKRMSTAHAVIRRVESGWELVDEGSKNGCRVDGVETKQTALRDGAWIEVGQTVLRFRSALPVGESWLDAEHATPVLDLVTLVPSLGELLGELARLANSTVPILITGETGTGKELLARAVHAASGRRGPFVAVNCAALSAGLVESQLFGHRRGAFSGAIADHDGFVRAAHGGTLLLDEIGDLPLPAQAALLRVVQELEVVPVGETRGVPVDVRFLAATHHDLRARIAAGALREDLYARLSGYVATLPPLSARREDLGTIVATALARHAGLSAAGGAAPGVAVPGVAVSGGTVPGVAVPGVAVPGVARERAATVRLSNAAAIRIATAPWPHNARELDKAIEVALALIDGDVIDADDLPPIDPESPDETATRARLEALLAAHQGNISRVAREMGKARMQIQRWLKRYRLDPAAYRR